MSPTACGLKTKLNNVANRLSATKQGHNVANHLFELKRKNPRLTYWSCSNQTCMYTQKTQIRSHMTILRRF